MIRTTEIWFRKILRQPLVRVKRKLIPDYGYLRHFRIRERSVRAEYFSKWNSGFFSNCSTALHDILKMRRRFIYIDKINFENSMFLYKDDSEKDIHPHFYNPVIGTPEFGRILFNPFDVHKHFKNLNLNELNRLVIQFFDPSTDVKNLVAQMLASINLEPSNTIAVYFRGTDKITEIIVPDFVAYEAAIDLVDGKNSQRLPILVQTDQKQARDYFIKRYGSRVRYFDDLPVTAESKGIHFQDARGKFEISPEEMAKKMLAAVLIIARCKHVITNSGNVGAWIAFYRGNADELYQYDSQGHLVLPG